ncbi:recombinase family protein [Streptomyces mirabilis]|uniref:recombinase family protein n=1 Tax=Streptomyces mirabilis TaxID=68239 RepID=UPI0033A600C9
MKRLGRDAAELTALADHLTALGLVLEMLAGAMPGMHDPSGPRRLQFDSFGAMAETERENIRESTLEGLDTAARKGKHGGRPPVINDDMLHTALPAGERRVRRADPPRADHPHRQAQGAGPQRREHLPRARRAREARGIPRSRRPGAHRLRLPPGQRTPRPASCTDNGTHPITQHATR